MFDFFISVNNKSNMISSITKLNDLIDICENKLMQTQSEKNIYRFYNLHKWMIKNGFIINEKKYNFSKILAKFTLIKAYLYVKPVKNVYFFEKNNAYLSYRSKNFFVIANEKIVKIFSGDEKIASVISTQCLRSFVLSGELKINGKNLTLLINPSYEKFFKISCDYERMHNTGMVLYKLKNIKAVSIFKNEKFFNYTTFSNSVINLIMCNNPFYNNYPYCLKSQSLKQPALCNYDKQKQEIISELPSSIFVLTPEKFNSSKHIEVFNLRKNAILIKREDEFIRCYFNRTISFFLFKKRGILKLNLNGEKCIIKKNNSGLKLVFNFGVLFLNHNAKILKYGIIDGYFVVSFESFGFSISCSLSIDNARVNFFQNFSKSIQLKKNFSNVEELLCANPIKTLNYCCNSFFINARNFIILQDKLDDKVLHKLLIQAQQLIKTRINLHHIVRHLVALLEYVEQTRKLKLIEIINLIQTLPYEQSLVDCYLSKSYKNISKNEIDLYDAIELEELINLFSLQDNSSNISNVAIIKCK